MLTPLELENRRGLVFRAFAGDLNSCSSDQDMHMEKELLSQTGAYITQYLISLILRSLLGSLNNVKHVRT